jgi:hypothetical protein
MVNIAHVALVALAGHGAVSTAFPVEVGGKFVIE